MKDYGLVSIVMPCFNTAQYIGDSIRSVINQTYDNWELLIVDDCSTDDSIFIIKEFKEPRIKLFQNEKNSGAAVSRNYALREAKGRWIAFLDSDDVWSNEKLEKQLEFMNDNQYSFTYTDYRICENGKWLPYINTGPDKVNKRVMFNYCYFSTITVMYQREKVGLIQIPDLKKNNDYAMWLRVIEKSDAYRLPECLSFYIKHDGSISSGSKFNLIKWHYALFRIGQGMNPLMSTVLTLNNLIHGIWKKYHYREYVREGEQLVTI